MMIHQMTVLRTVLVFGVEVPILMNVVYVEVLIIMKMVHVILYVKITNNMIVQVYAQIKQDTVQH